MRILVVLLSATLLLSIGCSTSVKTTSSTLPANAIKVRVTDYSQLDGCTFLLELPDGKKLQPSNLPNQFKKNGLMLFVTYKKIDGINICMAGTTVELIYVDQAK